MTDAVFLVLLVLHVGAVVSWMGGAILFVNIIVPSLSKMSPSSRSEFLQSALPRYQGFAIVSAIVAVIAGVSLYGYITTVATQYQPSQAGAPYVQTGAVIGLLVLILALGVMLPEGRKFLALTKQTPDPQTQPKIASLQKRMVIAGRLAVALLGIALILMVIGASL